MSLRDKVPVGVDDPKDIMENGREAWRLLGILSEFVEGAERLSPIRPAVSMFGSARLAPEHPYYQLAERIARKLSDAGFAVISGGGPGIMEAANRGAAEAGAPSIGFNISLPHEQYPNAWSTPALTFRFHYFAMRKMHLAMRANALVVFPGGFGTLDELFEILTLRQTGKSPPIPIVLYDRKFWEEVLNFQALVKHGVVGKVDETLFTYAETPEQAWEQCVKGGVMTRWLQEQHTT